MRAVYEPGYPSLSVFDTLIVGDKTEQLNNNLKDLGTQFKPDGMGLLLSTPSSFQYSYLYGMLGQDEESTALALSLSRISPSSRKQIMPVFIGSDSKGPRLFRGEKGLYSDLFLPLSRSNGFFSILTNQPVLLTGVDGNYSHFSDYFEGRGYRYVDDKEITAFTDDKWRTRQVFRKIGVRIPDGSFLSREHQADSQDKISDFVKDNPNFEGIVIKPNDGHCGEDVRMFGTDDSEVETARDFYLFLAQKGRDAVLEQRIIPKEVHSSRINGRVDFNLRTIITLSDKPEIIAHVVRFGEMGPDPINISQKAMFDKPDSFLTNPDLKAVEAATKSASLTLSALARQNDWRVSGILGMDVIVDRFGRPFIIEANTGAVGCFEEAVKLNRGEPLKTVNRYLLPVLSGSFVHDAPSSTPIKDLERVDPLDEDIGQLIDVALEYRDSSQAERVKGYYGTLIRRHPTNTDLLIDLGGDLEDLGDRSEAFNYFIKALEIDNYADRTMAKIVVKAKTRGFDYDIFQESLALAYRRHTILNALANLPAEI